MAVASVCADINGLRERYVMERPKYQRLARAIQRTIRTATQENGPKCRVEHRAKEVNSLVVKALKRGYTKYEEIGDKAGVRVVADFPWELGDLEDVIVSLFEVLERDDKRAIEPDKFGYGATHYQVRHPRVAEGIRGLECEVQVMTRAEHLWADTTHDLHYKPPQALPLEIQRIYHRLVSVIELFDLEINRAHEEVKAMPKSFGEQLLSVLTPHHQRMVRRGYDAELSEMVLDFLGEHVIQDTADVAGAKINNFISGRQDKISELISRYRGDESANPFLRQPELFVILSQLETNKFVLQERWREILPEFLLLWLADEWGVPINPMDQ